MKISEMQFAALAQDPRAFAELASQAAAEGPESVAALAAAVHSGNGPQSAEAHKWASGWACWAVYAHATGNGPWSR